MKNNKKGFTLIELLAVIVILAILVMLAIPAVTRYLQSARKNTFADNALRAVEAVRNDVVSAGFGSGSLLSGTDNRVCSNGSCTYNMSAINDLLENKLNTSSFGGSFVTGGCATITVTNGTGNAKATYTMKMVDSNGNGFDTTDVANIDQSIVKDDGSLSCS